MSRSKSELRNWPKDNLNPSPEAVTEDQNTFRKVILSIEFDQNTAIYQKISLPIITLIFYKSRLRNNIGIFDGSISHTRKKVTAFGGELNGHDKEWELVKYKVCEGQDPAGNIFQLPSSTR